MISAKDIILNSIKLYKQNAHLFIKYMLLLFIPTGIIAILGAIFGSASQMVYFYGFGFTLILYILIILIGSIASLWITLAFVKAINSCYEKQTTPNLKPNLLSIKKLIIPALLASILNALIMIGGFILLIVPGIIFAVWFAFTVYDVAINNTLDPIQALKNSKQLVDGRWFDVFWRLVAPGVIFTVSALLIEKIISWPISFALDTTLENTFSSFFLLALGSILSVLVSLFFTPLTTTAPVILYNELKKNPFVPHRPEQLDQISSKIEPPTME